jgi:hypothetical protein
MLGKSWRCASGVVQSRNGQGRGRNGSADKTTMGSCNLLRVSERPGVGRRSLRDARVNRMVSMRCEAVASALPFPTPSFMRMCSAPPACAPPIRTPVGNLHLGCTFPGASLCSMHPLDTSARLPTPLLSNAICGQTTCARGGAELIDDTRHPDPVTLTLVLASAVHCSTPKVSDFCGLRMRKREINYPPC